MQERLRNALLSPKLRRWCQFEWFYSAIDRPWFAQNEFMEYLDHLGMSQVRENAPPEARWVLDCRAWSECASLQLFAA